MSLICTCRHSLLRHSDMDESEEYAGACLDCPCKHFVPADEDDEITLKQA